MVENAKSSYLATTDGNVAFQIILDEVSTDEAANTSTVKIRVEVWRWDNVTTNYGGICTLYITGFDPVSNEWGYGEKPISYKSDTVVLELSDEAAVVIPHDEDGSKTIEIRAEVSYYNSSITSEPQGYDVELTRLQGAPQLGISAKAKSSTSIEVYLSATKDCDQWWYSLDNGATGTWVEFAQGTTGKTVSTTITGLVPRRRYLIKGCARPVGGTSSDDFYSKSFPVKTYGVTDDISNHIAIFAPTDMDFSTNGLGSLSDATSCIVTEERNGAFELKLEYPVNGINYEYLRYQYIIVANSNPYDDPEPFRIYSISKPINGIVTVNAAHISYDLSRWSVKPFKGAYYLWDTITHMVANIDGIVDFPFTVGTDMMANADLEDFETKIPKSFRSIIGEGDDSIIAKWDCEMYFSEYRILFLKSRGSDNGTIIRYSKNMTNFTLKGDCDNVYTRVRAFWYKEINEQDTWEEREKKGLVETSPRLMEINPMPGYPDRTMIVDMSKEVWKETYWDEKAGENKEREVKPTPGQLWIRFREQLEAGMYSFFKPDVSITVSFVNLYDSKEYESHGLQNLERVRLCDIVTVIFPKLLGEDDYTEENSTEIKMKCVKTVYNVLLKKYDSVELGMIPKDLATTISGQSTAINASASAVNHGSEGSGSGNPGGSSDGEYVIFDRDFKPNRFLSMDTPTATGATHVWKIDFNGISYSSNGVNGLYQTAMNQCGGIDANAVRTNSFDGNIIKPGTISKGEISSEYNSYVDGEIEKESKEILNESKFADTQMRDIHKGLYTDSVVMGKGKFVKVNGGIDFVLFD